MPDTQETKILKDINRHLAHIDENDKVSDRLSPSETAALNKNAGEIIGNFSSLISTETKTLINAGNKQLIEAFGNLKGFDTDIQATLLDEVVDELQTNNRFMAKGEHNDFLAEAEREQDLNINRRTNDLLEDLVEKEDDAASASAKSEASSSRFLGGGLGGLFGGLMAGKSIKGLFGAIKGPGKKIFFPALLAVAGVEFLRGWAEAGEDASVISKFNSGIGRMASDLTFGLVSKKFFTDALAGIENAIGKAWSGFTKNWDEFVNGKITGPDFFANIISGLSLGTLSPEQIKSIGTQIEDGMVDVVATIVAAITTGIITPMMDALSDQFEKLFTDPVAFFRDIIEKRKAAAKEEQQVKSVRIKELMGEGMSERKAEELAAWEARIDKLGFFSRFAAKAGLEASRKVGAFSETPAEAAAAAAKKQKADDLKAAYRADAKQRLADAKKKLADQYDADIKAKVGPLSNVGQEGLKRKVADAEALRNFKRQQEQSGGNAMQINQNNMVSGTVDTQTEIDDLNLQRSGETF